MKKGLKIALVVMTVLALIVGIVLACCQLWYLKCKNEYLEFEDSVLGKNSDQVQEMYGEFDHYSMYPCEDGLFRYTECSYTIIEKRVDIFGTTPRYMLTILFDGDGVAIEVFCQYVDF